MCAYWYVLIGIAWRVGIDVLLGYVLGRDRKCTLIVLVRMNASIMDSTVLVYLKLGDDLN